MSIPEDAIKNEMRIFALESIVCQHFATFYQTMPREVFDAVQKQAIEGMQQQTFAGVDAAHSDLFSAELQTSLERLYGMIRHHLDSAQTSQSR